MPVTTLPATRSGLATFAGGAIINALGGLTTGLGGAEFRFPLLMGVFQFVALQAVIPNNAMSLVAIKGSVPVGRFRPSWSRHFGQALNMITLII